MTQNPSQLKAMPLYRDVDRIYNELTAAGLNITEGVSVSDLTPFDQYHYHGTDAIDVAISALGITSTDGVLEIGSGIGGPSRYIAASSGAKVTALEIQPDLNHAAEDLTRRCGLSNLVDHVCADVLDFGTGGVKFDAIVSWLAFFHIEKRAQLLSRCVNWLKPSGALFVEDLYKRNDFSVHEQNELTGILCSQYLPNIEVYESDFRAAGFSSIQLEDMSEDWRQFTVERYADFCNNRERHTEVHGKEIVDGLGNFYGAVARLFSGGNLGGIRMFCSLQ